MKLSRSTITLVNVWSRRVHRWSMWLTLVLLVPMVLTGLSLEDIGEGESSLLSLFISPELVREVHRTLASPFAIMLGVMVASGLAMWGLPLLMRFLLKQERSAS